MFSEGYPRDPINTLQSGIHSYLARNVKKIKINRFNTTVHEPMSLAQKNKVMQAATISFQFLLRKMYFNYFPKFREQTKISLTDYWRHAAPWSLIVVCPAPSKFPKFGSFLQMHAAIRTFDFLQSKIPKSTQLFRKKNRFLFSRRLGLWPRMQQCPRGSRNLPPISTSSRCPVCYSYLLLRFSFFEKKEKGKIKPRRPEQIHRTVTNREGRTPEQKDILAHV